jgi:cyclophilin family peptidyl-prolyl cis-trans isomerase
MRQATGVLAGWRTVGWRTILVGALVGAIASSVACTAAPASTPVPTGPPCPPHTGPAADPQPPTTTPLAEAPAEVSGDGTRATLCTESGVVEIELFNRSAPVAAQNFIGLAEAGYYVGVPFHRIVPGFMVQGGDPTGSGSGGPGYTIPDEPFAGEYVRGTVAMARTPQPNSQGSQFFILVADASHLQGGGYTIFGRVTSGMDVVDAIVSGPRGGPSDDQALDPVLLTGVAIERP